MLRYLSTTVKTTKTILAETSYKFRVETYNRVKTGDIISRPNKFYRVFGKHEIENIYQSQNKSFMISVDRHLECEEIDINNPSTYTYKPIGAVGEARSIERKNIVNFRDGVFVPPSFLIADKENRFFHRDRIQIDDTVYLPRVKYNNDKKIKKTMTLIDRMNIDLEKVIEKSRVMQDLECIGCHYKVIKYHKSVSTEYGGSSYVSNYFELVRVDDTFEDTPDYFPKTITVGDYHTNDMFLSDMRVQDYYVVLDKLI